MEINTEQVDGTLIANVGGRIDGGNAQDFESAMQKVIEDADSALIIDLSDLSYISSAGLRVILLIAKTLTKRSAKFSICGLSGPINEIFVISGFNKIISIHDSREDAIAAAS